MLVERLSGIGIVRAAEMIWPYTLSETVDFSDNGVGVSLSPSWLVYTRVLGHVDQRRKSKPRYGRFLGPGV